MIASTKPDVHALGLNRGRSKAPPGGGAETRGPGDAAELALAAACWDDVLGAP